MAARSRAKEGQQSPCMGWKFMAFSHDLPGRAMLIRVFFRGPLLLIYDGSWHVVTDGA